ncbi:MAG: hypothetical protein ACLU6Y_03685 [Ruminococcus sp.]
MVELGTTREVFSNPQHEYTKTLLSAIPIPDPVQERQRKVKIYVDTDSDAEEWKEKFSWTFCAEKAGRREKKCQRVILLLIMEKSWFFCLAYLFYQL